MYISFWALWSYHWLLIIIFCIIILCNATNSACNVWNHHYSHHFSSLLDNLCVFT